MSVAAPLCYTPPSAQFRRRLVLLGALAAFLVGAGALLKFKPWLDRCCTF